MKKLKLLAIRVKKRFFEKIDELETNLQAFNRQITDELVEILQEDYSDNWVAKEVIELVTNS